MLLLCTKAAGRACLWFADTDLRGKYRNTHEKTATASSERGTRNHVSLLSIFEANLLRCTCTNNEMRIGADICASIYSASLVNV